MNDLEKLAAHHGLDDREIAAIGEAWAVGQGLLTKNDLAEGLASVVVSYLRILRETPSTFPPEHQPTAQLVVDRAAELLLARLQQSSSTGKTN